MGVRLETTTERQSPVVSLALALGEGAAEIRNKNARRTPSGCGTKLE